MARNVLFGRVMRINVTNAWVQTNEPTYYLVSGTAYTTERVEYLQQPSILLDRAALNYVLTVLQLMFGLRLIKPVKLRQILAVLLQGRPLEQMSASLLFVTTRYYINCFCLLHMYSSRYTNTKWRRLSAPYRWNNISRRTLSCKAFLMMSRRFRILPHTHRLFAA